MTHQLDFDSYLARRDDPRPSQEGAASVRPQLGLLKQHFLKTLRVLGTATANEVAAGSGRGESVRKRAKELERDGLIQKCDERKCRITGKLAAVYRIKH